MMGIRCRIAISWARSILAMVSGHHAPALTVASLSTTTASLPCTTPIPVMTPAPGAWPSYRSWAIRRPISTQGAPGSSRPATRSLGGSFPCWRMRSARSLPPPSRRRLARARYSAVSCLSLSVAKVPSRPGLDVVHEVAGGSAGPEEPAHAELLEVRDVSRRDDPAPGQQDVLPALLVEELPDPGEERHVGAAQDREAHHVHVLLDR